MPNYTTINKSTDHFNTKLYTGTGSSNAITGVGFQPDWVWIKGRSVAAGGNLSDVVRGVNKQLQSAGTFAEETLTTCVTAFDSDGFSLGSNGNVNGSSNTYVSWNWKANGSGSSNSDGSITSTVSANTTAGFSIVSYTGSGSSGATVGHGLGVKPDIIITKSRVTADNWGVYQTDLGATKGLYLNTTNAGFTASGLWNNTEPTSSIVTLGDNAATNDSGNMIMYCFHSVSGYSKFGSYTGNNNANGPFVYTGFKPAFTILKRTDSSDNWLIHDNKRKNPFNVVDTQLFTDLNYAESSSSAILDYCANGFKIRKTGGNINASGGTYIYLAFAESPFVNSNGVPTNAR